VYLEFLKRRDPKAVIVGHPQNCTFDSGGGVYPTASTDTLKTTNKILIAHLVFSRKYEMKRTGHPAAGREGFKH
jgi:hypothetical protein